MNPLVSIVIPVFNRGELIRKSIQSVFKQTYVNWELIIVDDCSTDNTVDVLKSLNDERIRLILLDKNGERGAARNAGIYKATGEFIFFLDSDDEFLPNHLSIIVDEMIRAGNKGLFFTNSKLEVEGQGIENKKVPLLKEYNVFEYLMHWTPNPARVAVNKMVFDDFKFDPTIPGLEDFDLWLRIASKYQVTHIPEYTNIYYLHDGGYSSGDKYETELKYFKYIFSKQILKHKLPISSKARLLSMCHYFLSVKAFENNEKLKTLKHALSSFALFPKGYNGKTSKNIMVMAFYSVPFIGSIIRRIVKLINHREKN